MINKTDNILEKRENVPEKEKDADECENCEVIFEDFNKTGSRVQWVRRMIVCRNRRWAASFAWKVPIYTRTK